MRILVIGREGQVARALADCASGNLTVETAGRPALDITDPASVTRAVEKCRPDIVVNAAAYTAVDQAESEPEAAFAVNCEGAGTVSAIAAERDLPIIHISTDYVFSGEKPEPYQINDPVAPLGIYGKSKLCGEKRVAEANPLHVVLRTSWVYSPWGRNFAKTMLRLAKDRDVVRVVNDQWGVPTYAPDIAQGIVAVARSVLRVPDATNWRGTFHMTSTGETTWAGFAGAIFAASADRGGPEARVDPISTENYPTPARRPLNSRLDSGQFVRAFSHALPDWHTGVERFADVVLRESPLPENGVARRGESGKGHG